MSGGLFALLDDIATLTKMSAAHMQPLTDAAVQTSVKATGVVVDDTAMAPQFVEGVRPSRELPMIGRIAAGSVFNKLVIILPIALLLSQFAPWLLSPLLMVGGSYLCFEGAEKVWAWIRPRSRHGDESDPGDSSAHAGPGQQAAVLRGKAAEKAMVRSAITTDFILSTEIMVISLGEVIDESVLSRTLILIVVGIALTVLVYGVVAVIVKMDDLGLFLNRRGTTAAGRRSGAALLWTMPRLLSGLSVIGTFAMLWVGGHIVLKGTADLGIGGLYALVEHAAEAVSAALSGRLGSALGWLTETGCSLVFGMCWGAILLGLWRLITLAWRRVRGAR